MQKITDLLKKKFTYSVELVPPRNGTDLKIVLDALETLRRIKVDFVSVTKGAGGSLRGGTLPICCLAHERFGITSVAHYTCREADSFRVENELVDQYYFGIKNVLALRGDPPDFGDDKNIRTGKSLHVPITDDTPSNNKLHGEYKHAYQLVREIKRLNNGKYIARKKFDTTKEDYRDGIKTDFCIGVAAHPEEKDEKGSYERGLEYLKKKVDEGADFAITQMLFDAERYKIFVDKARDAGIKIPIIPGIWPLDVKWKLEQAEKKFKVSIPHEIREKLSKLEDPEEFRKKGIEFTIELCKKLKKYGAPGIHLFLFLDANIAEVIVNEMRKA